MCLVETGEAAEDDVVIDDISEDGEDDDSLSSGCKKIKDGGYGALIKEMKPLKSSRFKKKGDKYERIKKKIENLGQ